MSNNYAPNVNYSLRQSNCEDKECILKFSMCDERKYTIEKLSSKNLKEFLKFAKKVEKLAWKDIRRDTGLNYEPLKNIELPGHISKDVTLHSMRLSQKFRIIGYKENEVFL